MALALVVLAAGSVVAGYVGFPEALGGSNRIEKFLEPSFIARSTEVRPVPLERDAEGADNAARELQLMGVSSLVAVGGMVIAWFFFLRNRSAADALAARFPALHRLLTNKYYVDELYDAAVVRPVLIASEEGLWKTFDVRIIDGTVNGAAATVGGIGQRLRRIQTGSVRVYAASVFFGTVLILGYYLWR